jgi:hypothetical protein
LKRCLLMGVCLQDTFPIAFHLAGKGAEYQQVCTWAHALSCNYKDPLVCM